MTESDLAALMASRREIDRELMEKHARDCTVLFTDIVGSTAYFETRGDIEGLQRVRRHNDVLFPVVEAHRGRVVKTIGDAIMATFDASDDGVRCALEMQRALTASEAGEDDPIQVRIGVHAGKVLVDAGDVFGDTVNVAARVSGAAGAGEVLVSARTYDALSFADTLRVAGRTELPLKGKAAPVPCVSLAVSDAQVAAVDAMSAELFVLEIGRSDGGLRVAALEGAADKGTVKAYAEQPLSAAALDEISARFRTLARDGGRSDSYLDEARAEGKALFDAALSERARERLAATDLRYLRLHLDDSLVHVPWELLSADGAGFLGLRFALGRVVAARADAAPAAQSPASGPAVVVSNPTGDLDAASREGRLVAGLLEGAGLFSGDDAGVRHLDGACTRAQFLEAIAGCRLLHFAGHARSDDDGGAFVLADGPLGALEIKEALGARAPSLVCVNACHGSGGTWRHEGMATALLTSGVAHFLAPSWDVPDEDALLFALRFYEEAVAGVAYGEAARRARAALFEGGTGPLSFAGYVLYGEPRRGLTPARPGTRPVRTRSHDKLPAWTEDAARDDDAGEAAPVSAPPAPPASVPFDDDTRPATATATAPVRAAVGGEALEGVTRVPGWVVLLGIATLLGIFYGIAVALWPETPTTAVAGQAAPPPPANDVVPPPVPPPATGPVRVSVLPFANQTGAPALDYLEAGLQEVVVTDLAKADAIKLIERGQIQLDIGEIEFGQTKYVDPATRARIGKIKGAEVVVLGALQKAGDTLRATARFVHVETGEILETAKVDGPAADVFGLQDALAAKVRAPAAQVAKTLRE